VARASRRRSGRRPVRASRSAGRAGARATKRADLQREASETGRELLELSKAVSALALRGLRKLASWARQEIEKRLE